MWVPRVKGNRGAAGLLLVQVLLLHTTPSFQVSLPPILAARFLILHVY